MFGWKRKKMPTNLIFTVRQTSMPLQMENGAAVKVRYMKLFHY